MTFTTVYDRAVAYVLSNPSTLERLAAGRYGVSTGRALRDEPAEVRESYLAGYAADLRTGRIRLFLRDGTGAPGTAPIVPASELAASNAALGGELTDLLGSALADPGQLHLQAGVDYERAHPGERWLDLDDDERERGVADLHARLQRDRFHAAARMASDPEGRAA